MHHGSPNSGKINRGNTAAPKRNSLGFSRIERNVHEVKLSEGNMWVFRFLWWPQLDMSYDTDEHQMTARPLEAGAFPFCTGHGLRRATEWFVTS